MQKYSEEDLKYIYSKKGKYPMSKSQIGQDIWVLEQLKFKKNGIFVDIGGGSPEEINNTFWLEKEFGWSGISIDIGPPFAHACEKMTKQQYLEFWKSKRLTPIVCGDALEMDYLKIFKEYNLPKIIDYISIDLEPPISTLKALLKVPFDEYQFNVITFEIDYYRDERLRDPSRKYLEKRGYKMIKSILQQEDWYIHENLLNNE